MVKKKEDDKNIRRTKASKSFVIALSVVSIIGFLSIVLESLFYIKINDYIETLWFITLGTGLILEISLKKLKKVKTNGLTPEILGEFTMLIVGSMAVIAGFLNLPQIKIQNSSFLAVKGIISILAIVFIILQTWITKEK
jgi:hypothetical protein